jgi:hypothetical protein
MVDRNISWNLGLISRRTNRADFSRGPMHSC